MSPAAAARVSAYHMDDTAYKIGEAKKNWGNVDVVGWDSIDCCSVGATGMCKLMMAGCWHWGAGL